MGCGVRSLVRSHPISVVHSGEPSLCAKRTHVAVNSQQRQQLLMLRRYHTTTADAFWAGARAPEREASCCRERRKGKGKAAVRSADRADRACVPASDTRRNNFAFCLSV